MPNLIAAKDSDLTKHLKGDSRWVQRAAWHQIADRQVTSLAPELKAIALDTSNTLSTRIHAIWSFESLRQFDESFLATVMKDSDHNLRREAIRSLASFEVTPSQVVQLLTPLLDDDHCLVRSQVLRTLEEVQLEDPAIIKLLVLACRPDMTGNALGGAYERNFERYLARKALESYPKALSQFLASNDAIDLPVGNLLWASQALSREDHQEYSDNSGREEETKPSMQKPSSLFPTSSIPHR